MSSVRAGDVSLSAVTKSFGSLQALHPLSIDITGGTVHAIVGENGAGKSTLVNILGGFVTPDSGQIRVGGVSIPLGDPRSARRAGIAVVHQHFMLVPAFSVTDNLRIAGITHGEDFLENARSLAKHLEWDLDWDKRVEELSVGESQRVEILKALALEPRVLILDEPTAVLGEDAVAGFIGFMRSVAAKGTTVLFIAHKIDEVLAASDRISVLRNGKLIVTDDASAFTKESLYKDMVGAEIQFTAKATGTRQETLAMSANEISVVDSRDLSCVRSVTLELRKGEILGIGGVDGNGQRELGECLAGVRKPTIGSVTIYDGEWEKVGYIPQDRHVDGSALRLTIGENMWAGNIDRVPRSKVSAWAQQLIKRFGIKAESPVVQLSKLSGGNQQKVVVSRNMDRDLSVIVAHNPTRGLDALAAKNVHDGLRELSLRGVGVVLISTDRDELGQLSDRTLYMGKGTLFQTEAEALGI